MSEYPAIDALAPHMGRPVEHVLKGLQTYEALLRKWQNVQNLVSRETLPQLWQRHFVDSLQVLSSLKVSDRLILDIGSGGGFPALPLAIASKGLDRRFVLVEPTGRKVSFLRTVIRELDLEAKVIAARTEATDSRETGVPDVITSRALASLVQLCDWMEPFFGSETRAVLHKGREHVEERAEADALYDFDVLSLPSITDTGGVILTVTNLRRKSVR
jgi:16S rRNA (guanine527-N7)-methyltransferase